MLLLHHLSLGGQIEYVRDTQTQRFSIKFNQKWQFAWRWSEKTHTVFQYLLFCSFFQKEFHFLISEPLFFFFFLMYTPLFIVLSFVCFDLIHRSSAQSLVLMFPVFLSWGTHIHDTASLSIIPVFFRLKFFSPAIKREHTDGTGNLAASYTAAPWSVCQTLTGNEPVIGERAAAGVVV